MDQGAPFCGSCGEAVQKSVGQILLTVVSIVLFIVIGLPALLIGGCVVILEAGSPGLIWLYGLAAVALGMLLIFFMVSTLRALK
jgi:hypothetical protein